MLEDNFHKTCDQVSHIVDEVQYERFRWTRDEAPKLARMVELLHGAFASREDFELAEEGATNTAKRFAIKIHGKRIIAVCMELQNGKVVMECDTLERSHFTLVEGETITDDFENLDECWMEQALQLVLGRIRSTGSSPPKREI